MADCPNEKKNRARCTCSYGSCSRQPMCCECLHYHLGQRQLPACCFPAHVEKTFDRSFEAFIKAWS